MCALGLLVGALTLSGCEGGELSTVTSPGPLAQQQDQLDGGATDAEWLDAEWPDVEWPDAGEADAGGLTDAGEDPPLDAGDDADAELDAEPDLGPLPMMDADLPDADRPDAMELPDAFRPDAVVPDAVVPDAAVPDVFVPPIPDMFVPPQPDADVPDDEVPDAEVPDAEIPDAEVPDAEIPDMEIPDLDLPDVFVPPPPDMFIPPPPDAEVPDAEVPDAEIPDAEIPDAEIPDAEIPDMEIPDMEIPDAEVPDLIEPRPRLEGPVDLRGWPGRNTNWFDALAASPDGRFVAAAYKDVNNPAEGRLGLWRTDSGERVWQSQIWLWSEGCDFTPDGDRILCAHNRRPDTRFVDLITFDAANGAVVGRATVDMGFREAQPEPWWGDSARVSPDGRWAAMAVTAREGGVVFVFSLDGQGRAQEVARLPQVRTVDEVVFSPDSTALYASDFAQDGVFRFRRQGNQWISDGLRQVNGSPAGLDVDGEGRLVVAGFWSRWIYVIEPRARWQDSPVREIDARGVAYDVCADARPGAAYAWAVNNDGGVMAIETDTGRVLSRNRIDPVDVDGIAMSCTYDGGDPWVVSRGRVWTWVP